MTRGSPKVTINIIKDTLLVSALKKFLGFEGLCARTRRPNSSILLEVPVLQDSQGGKPYLASAASRPHQCLKKRWEQVSDLLPFSGPLQNPGVWPQRPLPYLVRSPREPQGLWRWRGSGTGDRGGSQGAGNPGLLGLLQLPFNRQPRPHLVCQEAPPPPSLAGNPAPNRAWVRTSAPRQALLSSPLSTCSAASGSWRARAGRRDEQGVGAGSGGGTACGPPSEPSLEASCSQANPPSCQAAREAGEDAQTCTTQTPPVSPGWPPSPSPFPNPGRDR